MTTRACISRGIGILAALAISAIPAEPATAQTQSKAQHRPQSPAHSQPVTIGTRTSIHSQVLGETRPLLVYLPREYETTKAAYPVLYLLDGDPNFHHATGVVDFLSGSMLSPPLIVVAIPNTDRMRDFAPAPATGQEQFGAFLKDELIPHIHETYRANSYRILWGHSATGAFLFNMLGSDPELFNAYLAASPSFGRDPETMISSGLASLAGLSTGPRILLTGYGTIEDERFSRAAPVLKRVLRDSAPAWLTWRVDWFDNDDHMTTRHKNLYEGLERIFAPWRIDRPALLEGGIAYLENQQKQMRENYGAEWVVPESVIGPAAMHLLNNGKFEQAIPMLELNARQNPGSWLALHGLGVALVRHGDANRAEELFTTAASLYPDGVYYQYVLNGLAYELLAAEKNDRSLALFKFIVQTYRDSANAYDSLAEAYMKSGQIDLAIANYKTSIRLDPGNTNAVKMLKQLQNGG